MSEILRLHSEFCEHSLVLKGNSPRTIQGLQEAMRLFVEYSKIENISDLSGPWLESWIVHSVKTRNWSAKTIRLRLCYMSLFCDWCRDRNYLPSNPCEKIPRPKLPKRIPKSLSEAQCEKILQWLKNHPFFYEFERVRAIAVIATFMATGLRRSELQHLEVRDLNLTDNELFVRRGKGGKDRRIPFRPSLAKILRDYDQERKRLKRCCPQAKKEKSHRQNQERTTSTKDRSTRQSRD